MSSHVSFAIIQVQGANYRLEFLGLNDGYSNIAKVMMAPPSIHGQESSQTALLGDNGSTQSVS